MKVIAINGVNYGSTGNIMLNIQKEALSNGIDYYVAFAKSRTNKKKSVKNGIYIGSIFSRNVSNLLNKITGFDGLFNCLSTYFFIRKISKISPNIIHIHNLHGNYINIRMLFKYLKKHKDIHVVWTLHDCWSFTGRCPHFLVTNCYRWKSGCMKCPYPKNMYPTTTVDRSKKMWQLKNKWFSHLKHLNIVTPSFWLAELTKESFLKTYPINTIHNGINLDLFKPTSSDFRELYNIKNKYVVLGVADSWSDRKGIDVFIELSSLLTNEYQIVLVGTNNDVDKMLPDNIISIHRTSDQGELAKIYSSADVFVNPTREEVLGLVNIEALACGTPVITFDSGGCSECVDDTCGSVVPTNNIAGLIKEIVRICGKETYSSESCMNKASQFDMNGRFLEYIALYKQLLGVDKSL